MSEEPQSSLIFYQTEDGQTKVEVRLVNETVWLSAGQMAELFQRDKSTISKHIDNIFAEGELTLEATVARFATVQTEGGREVTRDIEFFNLDVIISVGYRVRKPMHMRDWVRKLDDFLHVNDRDILKDAGRVSQQLAKEQAEAEFDKYHHQQQAEAAQKSSPVFDEVVKRMRDECGVDFEGRIMNKRERRVVRLKKQRLLDPDFQILWDKIKHKTRYAVRFSTTDVVKRAAEELKSMPAVQSPFIQVTKAQVGISTEEWVTVQETASAIKAVDRQAPIPDLIGYLQRETEMTHSSLAAILLESGRLGEVRATRSNFSIRQWQRSCRHCTN